MRNPYLLLGVDYGVRPSEARRRFAAAARRVRRAADSAITIEDLNWALHELQNRQGDPSDDVATFRVPANPAVLAPVDHGLFSPPPVPLPRTTKTSPADLAAIEDAVAAEASPAVGAVIAASTTFEFGYRTPEGQQV